MIIQAGMYKLRSFNEDDATNFYNLAHDDAVKRYVYYAYPKSIEEAKDMAYFYSKGDLINDFYLLIQQEDTLVGMIVAVKTINKTLDTSVFISKDFRGKGIMTIAMKSFINWLYNNTDYEKMVMEIDVENTASNRQIKKINGIFQGMHRNNNIYEVRIR